MTTVLPNIFPDGLFKRVIYCGDNLKLLKQFTLNSIDLICFDPPFNSKKEYNNKNEKEGKTSSKPGLGHFNDIWEAGYQGYKQYMLKLVQSCKDILKPNGIIIIHCDKSANFHIRSILNDVFGESHFINEIIWCYHGGGAPKHTLKQKHDTIYVYRKGLEYTFNPILIPRDKIKYYKQGVAVKTQGKYLNDWWCDIPSKGTATQSKEWVGYPTQKPLELYKRLIQLFSNKGDIVLDPFMGSGTTLISAEQLGRYPIGIDKNREACRLSASRLRYPLTNIIGLSISYSELMKLHWYDVQCWICYQLNGIPNKKGGDGGFDGYIPLNDQLKYPGSKSNIPIQVKKGEAKTDEIKAFQQRLTDKDRKYGIFIAKDFSRGIKEEIAKISNINNLEIRYYKIRDFCKIEGIIETPNCSEEKIIPIVKDNQKSILEGEWIKNE